MKTLLLAVLAAACAFPAFGGQFDKHVPIATRGASTYYVQGNIEGYGLAPLLVDTGSGYSTIDKDTFVILEQKGHTKFIKKLRGIMADGSHKIVPIYRISSINLGGECLVRDVEVAVFPAKTRLILGLSALRKVAPFAFSLDDPPSLMLSNCQQPELKPDPEEKPAQRFEALPTS